MASSQKNARVRAVNTANAAQLHPIRSTDFGVAALHVAEIAHSAADSNASMNRASPIEPVQKDSTADPSGSTVVTSLAASSEPEDAPRSITGHEQPVRIVAIAAPFVMQPAPAYPDLLPCELAARIRRGVEAAVDGRYGADPIFSVAASRVSSVQDSLQRRDGLYAEAAVIAGLDMSPRVRVLRDPRVRSIAVSRAADEIATHSTFATCQMIDLPDDEPTGAMLTTDVVAIDSRLGEAIGLESKRGAKIGSDDRATLVHRMAIASMQLRAHLLTHDERVERARAHVLVHHDGRGLNLPDGMTVTAAALDERLETRVVDMTAEARAYHAGLAARALAPLFAAAHAEAERMMVPVAPANANGGQAART